MMPVRPLWVALTVLAVSGAPTRVLAGCRLVRFAHLTGTMTGLRPMVSAKINGADALFIADSGAFYSTITSASAAQLKLRLEPAPTWFVLRGVGGETR